ncbi:hypothetical protein ANCCAN_15040 [Ancylostoma caninum]|uniref:Uncharacterized protein n=1 Tax=Ancylostoma caninum TaxID=29170 RepID=A0A368G5V4_ANCCA|nr:hypothetical protein ANCCAN_15040 [Ancylostoma caninum]
MFLFTALPWMLILLLLIYSRLLEGGDRPNLKFPLGSRRLHDDPLPDPLPSPFGNKVYLKNKLLDNLNSFFPNAAESLEIFGSHEANHRRQPPPPESNSIIDPVSVPGLPRERFFSPIQNLLQNSLDHNPFPTLVPTESPAATSDTPIKAYLHLCLNGFRQLSIS